MPDDYARLRDRMRGWRDDDRDEFRRGQGRDYGGREDRDIGGYRDDRYSEGGGGRPFAGREGGRFEDEGAPVRRYRFSSHDEGATGQGRSSDYGSRYGSSRNYDYGSSQGEDRNRERGGYGAASLLTGDYGRWNEDYQGRRDEGRRDYGRSGSGGQRDERGFFERAGDEMATWFGSEGAERRRERDAHQGDEGAQHHRGRGPSGYRRSDSRITEDINDRLTEDAYIDASEVQVRVENGEVTLDGTVNSRTAKRRAEDIAEAISGVSHVQNNLRVRQQTGDFGRSGGMGQSGAIGTGAMAGSFGSGSYGAGTTGATGAGGTLGTAGSAGTGPTPETDTLTGTTAGSGGTIGTRRTPD
jgi:osmotically-inducible protein OsmY